MHTEARAEPTAATEDPRTPKDASAISGPVDPVMRCALTGDRSTGGGGPGEPGAVSYAGGPMQSGPTFTRPGVGDGSSAPDMAPTTGPAQGPAGTPAARTAPWWDGLTQAQRRAAVSDAEFRPQDARAAST